jgi:hypothetical protein
MLLPRLPPNPPIPKPIDGPGFTTVASGAIDVVKIPTAPAARAAGKY